MIKSKSAMQSRRTKDGGVYLAGDTPEASYRIVVDADGSIAHHSVTVKPKPKPVDAKDKKDDCGNCSRKKRKNANSDRR